MSFLEIVDARPGTIARIPIYGDNITIGHDAQVAQVVLNDSSVSRLHARIRQRGDDYWLYDEGSNSGTSLNYERLGLAPRLLSDNDTIQIGRVSLRFCLTTLDPVAEAEDA
jgi:pSer/pThr/pTyr-binding forkhead associated (FHA) protein